jgi:hypothetical protein
MTAPVYIGRVGGHLIAPVGDVGVAVDADILRLSPTWTGPNPDGQLWERMAEVQS